MKERHLGNYLYVLFFVLLLVFEFFTMRAQVLRTVDYYAQIVYVLAFAFSIMLLVIVRRTHSNCFLSLFSFWMLYNVLRFLTSTTGHDSMVSFFRYTWFCNCYIITFIAGQQSTNRESILKSFSLLLFIIAVYFTYESMIIGASGYIDLEDIAHPSNIVFWSLCILPVVFMFKNQMLQLVMISIEIILVLVTMKRSAVITMAFLLVLFVFSVFSRNSDISKKKQIASRAWTISIIIVGVLLLSPRLSNLFDNNLTRFAKIEEDGGSNRVNVWKDSINGINSGSLGEIVFGHGVASSEETIHHTSCHNDFLTLFLEFGLIGASLYLFFIIRILKRIFFCRKHNRNLFHCYTSLAIVLLVVGNVGDLFTCYTYLGFLMVILAVLELRLEQFKICSIPS